MVHRVILDSNVLIDIERGGFDASAWHDHDLAVAAVSVAEFRQQIELTPRTRRARLQGQFLETMLQHLIVLDYTLETARHHARLLAETRLAGRPRGRHDLIIAAHAAETGRGVVTRDAAARFGRLGGVRAFEPGEI
jgi:predicted nucleic acid-binding protein